MDIWLTHHDWCTRQSWPNGHGLAFYPAGRQTRPITKVVLHSTETLGWPGYRSGASAPHFTINLWTGQVRQHIPLNYGARALAVSTGGVTDRTVNIGGVVQIELIGAVTPGYSRTYGHYDLVNRWPDDAVAHRYLARLLGAIHEAAPTFPLQLSSYGRWVPYPASYGVRASQRLSSWQYADARGVLGHQHVPANDHGDPGQLVGLDRVIALAKKVATAPAQPAPDPRRGFTTAHLDYIAGLLADLGYTGDVWAATLAYQTDHHLDPLDGLPGPQTTTHLEDTMAKIDDVLKELKALRTAVDRTPAKVWSHRIPFSADTSVGRFFGKDWRAGALAGYSALAAQKALPEIRDEILAAIETDKES